MHRLGALILAVCVVGVAEAGPRLRPVQTQGFAIGVIADWHGGGVSGHGYDVPGWLAAQDPKPEVVLHAGDVYLANGGWPGLKEAFAAEGMTVYTCLGNHDFDLDPSEWENEVYPNGESPLDDIVAPLIPELGKVPYYKKDFGPVRVLFLDNCYDTTVVLNDTLYAQDYAQANPPGRAYAYWVQHGFPNGNPNGTNPEYAGWVTSDTTMGQLAWIKEQTAGFGGTFILAVAHRASYAPYVGNIGRPLDLGGRNVGWAIVSRAGADLALTGDVHSCGLTKRMYRGVQSPLGTYFLTTRIGFKRDGAFGAEPRLTEDDTYWPKEASLTDANEANSIVFAYVVFAGDRATVKVIQEMADGTFVQRSAIYIDRRAR